MLCEMPLHLIHAPAFGLFAVGDWRSPPLPDLSEELTWQLVQRGRREVAEVRWNYVIFGSYSLHKRLAAFKRKACRTVTFFMPPWFLYSGLPLKDGSSIHRAVVTEILPKQSIERWAAKIRRMRK
jgi:hypothetical protein